MRRFDKGAQQAARVPALFTRSYLALAEEHDHAPRRYCAWRTSQLGSEALFIRGIMGFQRIAPDQFIVWFDFAMPPYADLARHRVGEVHWGMPTCSIRLPAHLLDEPLPHASPLALKDALTQCEQAERVRRELVLQDDGYPSLETVAERRNISTRTLRRRLQDQGVGYMDLLHAARRRDALSLLQRPALEMADIAQILGYADPANFTRAFKQWTGLTPSAWREGRR